MPEPNPLRLPEFRAYLSFRGLMTFGLQMQAIIIGYHLYAITKDPLSLGLLGLAEAVPAIATALYAGYVADRSEKRGLLQLIVAITALISTGIVGAHYGAEHAYLSPMQYEWVLYALIFMGGLARGFYSPAGSSLFGLLLPKELYAKGSAWSSVVWQAGTVLGPTLGGFIYAWAGAIWSQWVVVGCLVGAFFTLYLIDKRLPSPLATASESISDSIRQGLAFVKNQRLLLGAISLDMLSVFFGGTVALLPIYAQDILHVGAEGMGMLRAADAVGSVAMMLVLTRLGAFARPWHSLLLAVAGFGATIIGFGLTAQYGPAMPVFGLPLNYLLALAWLIAMGAFDAVSVVIRSTLQQTLTPQHMRGRVSSINSVFVASSNEIGSFESGLTARLMGTVPATLFGGCMTLLIVGGFSRLKTKGQDKAASTTEPDTVKAVVLEEKEKTPPMGPAVV